MSNVIELSFNEIDTVVGGTNRVRPSAPPTINYNRTHMANSTAALASSSYAPSASMGSGVDTSALHTRLDAMR